MVCAVRITGLPFVAAGDEPNAAVTDVGLRVVEPSLTDFCRNTSRKRCAAISVRKSESAAGTLVRHGQSRSWVPSDHARHGYATEKLSAGANVAGRRSIRARLPLYAGRSMPSWWAVPARPAVRRSWTQSAKRRVVQVRRKARQPVCRSRPAHQTRIAMMGMHARRITAR